MRIPSGSDVTAAAPPPSLLLASSSGNNKSKTGDWASFIGIVTAICGNILISIALNTQRYAHIRLNQQYQERQRLLRRAQRRVQSGAGYGTAAGIGSAPKERARQQKGGGRESGEDDEVVGENEPLLLLSSSMHSEGTTDTPPLLGAATNAEEEEEAQKSYLRSPYWWAGIILMTVGEAGNFLAYGFAPASIVSPLGVVALISNCVIAPFFLKEPFRKRDLIGVVIAVAGAVTVVLSASDSNPKLGPNEIWRLISTWEFKTYFGITVALICALMWASSRYGEKSIFIDLGLVGLFGGYTALSTKGVASMFSYTVFKALTFPITYLLLLILISTAVMQIKYVNRALKRFDATQVIPTQFVMFTLSVIIGSAVLYRDFEKESGEDAGKFIGGCAMTFLGVYFITSARRKDEEEDEVLEEDEEAIRLAAGDYEGAYHDDPESRPQVRRSSTAPMSGLQPVLINNGHKSLSPFSGSPPDSMNAQASANTPIITRTNTDQSDVQLSGTSEFGSSLGDATTAENPWIAPEDQTTAARSSMQKLLRPLNRMFSGQNNNKLPRTLKTTYSEPLLPTEATVQSDRPRTPPNASYFPSDTALHTIQPDERHHLLSRHSITDLIPGPFTATLSSPLSAIVADSLRRGVDVRSLKPKRGRKLPGMPRLGGSLQPQRGNSETDARVFQRPTEEEGAAAERRTIRIRSLSSTVGDFFRGRKRSEEEEDGAGIARTQTLDG